MSESSRRPDLRPESPLDYAPRRIRDGIAGRTTKPLPEDSDQQTLAALMNERPLYRDARERAIAEKTLRRPRPIEMEPPEDETGSSRIGLIGVVAPIAAVVGLMVGGFFFYSQISPATTRPATSLIPANSPVTSTGTTTAFESTRDREVSTLRVEDSSGAINEILPLGVKISAPAPGAMVYLRGMALGARLTTGVSIAPGEWRIPANDLVSVAVIPPRDYAGVMNISAELHEANDRSVFSNSFRLTWTAPAPKPADIVRSPDFTKPADVVKPVETAKPIEIPKPVEIAKAPEAVKQPPDVAKPTVVASAADPTRSIEIAKPDIARPIDIAKPVEAAKTSKAATAPPVSNYADGAARKIAPPELVMLIKRGEELAASGDLPAARLLLQRAAEAHNPRAAFVLATTYDPIMLKRLPLTNPASDVGLAQAWYQKAKEWGSTEAAEKLEALASKDR